MTTRRGPGPTALPAALAGLAGGVPAFDQPASETGSGIAALACRSAEPDPCGSASAAGDRQARDALTEAHGRFRRDHSRRLFSTVVP